MVLTAVGQVQVAVYQLNYRAADLMTFQSLHNCIFMSCRAVLTVFLSALRGLNSMDRWLSIYVVDVTTLRHTCPDDNLPPVVSFLCSLLRWTRNFDILITTACLFLSSTVYLHRCTVFDEIPLLGLPWVICVHNLSVCLPIFNKCYWLPTC